MTSYVVPTSLDDASARIAAGGIAIAGGTVAVPALRPGDTMIALRRLTELAGVRAAPDRMRIGACATLAVLADIAALGAVRDAALAVGNPHVRRMATLGGNLGWTDQPTDLEVALLALGAEAELVVDGQRIRLPVSDVRSRLRARRAIIVAVDVPIVPRRRSAFVKLTTRRASSAGLASVAVALDSVACIAVGGVALDAQRCPIAEARFAAGASLAAIAEAAADEARITRGADTFRRRALRALVARAAARIGVDA